MKKLIIYFILSLIWVACKKDKKHGNGGGNNGGNKDTTYVEPTDNRRFTKKMAGAWAWKGWYIDGASKLDSVGGFDVTYLNDTTVVFKGTNYTYQKIVTRDSLIYANYINKLLIDISSEAEGISYLYLGDSLIYDRYWDNGNKHLRLVGHRK